MAIALDRFRKRKHQGVEVVADLDALIEKPLFFRFKEETYEIRPLSTKECLQVYAQFVNIQGLAKQDEITGKEIIDAYVELFSKVCPRFGRKQVEAMNIAQLTALYTLVIKTITGEQHAAEKKTPLIPTQGSLPGL